MENLIEFEKAHIRSYDKLMTCVTLENLKKEFPYSIFDGKTLSGKNWIATDSEVYILRPFFEPVKSQARNISEFKIEIS